jgi:hypothetical protein
MSLKFRGDLIFFEDGHRRFVGVSTEWALVTVNDLFTMST